ncbi:MAG: DUF2877 domain-containing protein [Chloroflexi bacterium]|nr:DUF2877 domain-containing protein [Chloroflexota bacterium]
MVASIGRADLIGAKARELFVVSDAAKRSRVPQDGTPLRCVPDYEPRVLAVVSNAAYLEVGGEIIWLAQLRLPMHRRAIRGEFDFSAMRSGKLVEREALELRDVAVWQPTAMSAKDVAPRDLVIEQVRALRDVVRPEGFPKTLRVSESVRALVGLGAGLTPSGDDFLGGMFFAVYHLQRVYPGEFEWNQRAMDEFLEWARPRTNAISHAILSDHAQGQSVEPLHDLIAALLKAEGLDQLMLHVGQLVRIGSTSGRDMLAGLLAGMALAESH